MHGTSAFKISFLPTVQPPRIGFIMFVSQMWKLRHRAVAQLPQGHIVSKQQSGNLQPS